jgi:hypothetical protein
MGLQVKQGSPGPRHKAHSTEMPYGVICHVPWARHRKLSISAHKSRRLNGACEGLGLAGPRSHEGLPPPRRAHH